MYFFFLLDVKIPIFNFQFSPTCWKKRKKKGKILNFEGDKKIQEIIMMMLSVSSSGWCKCTIILVAMVNLNPVSGRHLNYYYYLNNILLSSLSKKKLMFDSQK